jgi:MFS family permease
MPGKLRRLGHSIGLNRTVVALSIARLADGIGNSTLFVIIPLYVYSLPDKSFDLPLPLLVGILISAYGFAVGLLQPFTGALADRLGCYKLTISVGLVVLVVAMMLYAFADRYINLLGLRVLQGAGLALEIPSTMALMALVTQRATRGGAMGFYTTARMVGLASGPLLGGFIHVHFGFTWVFYSGAAVLFLALAIVLFGVKEKEVRAANRTREQGQSAAFALSLLSPGIASAAIATFLLAASFTLMTTLENEFNSRLGINALGFSFAFSALMVGRLLFQVPLGWLSDRHGRRWFVFVGLLFLALTTALLGEVRTLYEFVALRFVQGIAGAAIVAPALAYAGDVAEADASARHGRVMSIVTTGFGFGLAFGPLLAGILAMHSFELPFAVTGGLCLIGALMVGVLMTEEQAISDTRQ